MHGPIAQDLDDVRGLEETQTAREVVPHARIAQREDRHLHGRGQLPRRCDDAVYRGHHRRMGCELLSGRGGVVRGV
jgi:hypothetical protein